MPRTQSSSRIGNFVSTSKNLLENRNWTFPAVRYFTWKLELVSNILWMIVDCLDCYIVTSGIQVYWNWIGDPLWVGTYINTYIYINIYIYIYVYIYIYNILQKCVYVTFFTILAQANPFIWHFYIRWWQLKALHSLRHSFHLSLYRSFCSYIDVKKIEVFGKFWI